MQGFSVPRSPQGRTSLTPPPPWFYAGNLLLVDYAADPQAVAAVLPPGLAPDPGDPENPPDPNQLLFAEVLTGEGPCS